MHCPNCLSCKIKKNGHTHYGKQNYQCKACKRQFVFPSNHYIEEGKRALIRNALIERLSLRGICRVFQVSLSWLLEFMVKVYSQAPQELGAWLPLKANKNRLQLIGLELDEAWSYVGNKANKCWIWVVLEPEKGQVVCFHIGSRGIDSAKALCRKIPRRLRIHCDFHTDQWEAYKAVIPQNRHFIGKDFTRHIERLFCTMRQRMSRLVRKNLAFSKIWSYHKLAIRYFLWQFNLNNRALHL